MLNRKRVIDFAAAHRLPAIYEYDFLVRDGGLMSYGPDLEGMLRARRRPGRRASSRAPSPPTCRSRSRRRYPFVINLKTAKAIGLTIPPTLLARADEVIE